MDALWPSPAKLNLFLYITEQRADGYHNLQTLFQFLDYGDTLKIEPTQDAQIRLAQSLPNVADADNLIVRAAKLLQSYTGCHAGAIIEITKRIPMGGGLGGGSSNAATVLLVLNQLWQCHLSLTQLAELGVQLGADVPIFIHGHAALAEGIGDKLTPVSPDEKWYLVAHPGITIPTATIFQDPDLPRNNQKRSLNELLSQPFVNNCEEIVQKRFIKVELLISWLLQYAPARLTGTGACVFAEFDTEQAAQHVLNRAPSWVYGFVAKGVNVSPLHRKLLRLR